MRTFTATFQGQTYTKDSDLALRHFLFVKVGDKWVFQSAHISQTNARLFAGNGEHEIVQCRPVKGMTTDMR